MNKETIHKEWKKEASEYLTYEESNSEWVEEWWLAKITILLQELVGEEIENCRKICIDEGLGFHTKDCDFIPIGRNIKINLNIYEDQKEALVKEAEERRVNLSVLIRETLQKHINKNE